jgi:hypothetical protein
MKSYPSLNYFGDYWGIDVYAFDKLFMREKNDFRRDSIIKKQIFNQQIKDVFNVVAVWDDRIQVCVETWYKLGLFCFCTNQGLKEY